MAEPIRVAQVLNRMDSGGIEAALLNYYRYMDHSRLQFDFYYEEGSTLPQREELLRLGAGLYPIPPYSHVRAYHRALYRAFRQHGYRIVHAHLSTMSVFPLFAARRAGVPVRICHNHSTASWKEGKKTLLKYLLRPFGRVFATDYFACGEMAARWMYGGRLFESGRVTVMPNAIDTAAFTYDAAARTELRMELGISQDAFVVGHVGRFMQQKNHAFLIRIFACLAGRLPRAVLLLVGTGELEPSVRAQVEKAGLRDRVIFTGARRDTAKLYSVMDVFCLPSFYEGMPLVAWEAQANGLPCLFSDCISDEAVRGENAKKLPLSAPAEEWAAALTVARRRPAPAVPDIRCAAHERMLWYLQKDQSLNERKDNTLHKKSS